MKPNWRRYNTSSSIINQTIKIMSKIEKAIWCSDYKGLNVYTLNRFDESGKRMFIVHFYDFLKPLELERITSVISRLEYATAKMEEAMSDGAKFTKFIGPEFGGGFYIYADNAREVYEHVMDVRYYSNENLFLNFMDRKFAIFDHLCHLMQNNTRHITQNQFADRYSVDISYEHSKICIKDEDGNVLNLRVEQTTRI